MIIQLRVKLFLLLQLLLINNKILAQQSAEVYIVHPSVGDTIDINEKIRYGLFPFYKKTDFNHGIFYLLNGSYVLSSKINDTIVNRTFTLEEVQHVQKLIQSASPRKKIAPNTETSEQDTLHTSCNTVISISPHSVLKRINISIETGISSKITAGLIYTHYFSSSFLFHMANDASSGDIKGDRFQLFLRGYWGKRSNSPYIQVAGITGYFSESNFYNRPDTSFSFVISRYSYYAFGASLKLGRQWLVGSRKHFVIDFNIGFQFVPRKLPEEINVDGYKYILSHNYKQTAQPITDNRPYLCSNFMLGWKF